MTVQEQWNEALKFYLERVASAVGAAPAGDVEEKRAYYERRMLDEPPPGCAKGLLLPSHNHQPPPREVRLEDVGVSVIPEKDWPDLIAKQRAARAAPREHVWTTLNQGSVGSCASEAKDGVMMLVREISNQKRVLFNPYGTYGRVNRGVDGGSTLADNISFAQRYGCFPEDVWPRSKGWRAEPSKEAYEAAAQYRLREVVRITSKAEFGTCLLLGIPIYFGYVGHAIFAIELIDTQRFWYQNSWGADWGQNGKGTLSFSSVYWAYGVYAILSETWAGPDARLAA